MRDEKRKGEEARRKEKMPMSFKGTSKNLFSVNLLVNEERRTRENGKEKEKK